MWNRKRLVTLSLAVCFAVCVVFTGCHQDEREFLADISVPLEDTAAEIVIKEWQYLLGSGAEIYYREDDKLTLLGKTTGGDDGYCPFQAGKFKLDIEGNELTVRWGFRGSDPEELWKEKRFTIPNA